MVCPGGDYKCVTMQNAAVAVGNGIPVNGFNPDDGGYVTLTAQVQGITTATVTWEATIDGTNWVAVQFTNLTDGVDATTATSDGLYRIVISGFAQVRARISAWTSGTITVTGVSIA